MLLKLLNLRFFSLFCVVCNSFFTIPVVNKSTKLKLALAIPTGVPITLGNDAIETPPTAADKAIKDLSK